MQWQIRPAKAADLAAIPAIDVQAGRRFRDVGLEAIAEGEPVGNDVLQAHLEAGTAWVAVDQEGRLIAFAIASRVDGQGHLDQISALESAGGHGIGRALIDTVHDWARQQDATAVTLTTFASVPWNGPYYERLGYVELAEADQGPELRAIRRDERAAGIDILPRIAMRHSLGRG